MIKLSEEAFKFAKKNKKKIEKFKKTKQYEKSK